MRLMGPGAMPGSPSSRAPGTSHGPPARSGGPAPGLPNAEAESKLALAEGSKQPWDAFASSCGAARVGAPWEKTAILAPRPEIQVGSQGVLPAGPKHGADRPRLTSSLLQSKRDRTAV